MTTHVVADDTLGKIARKQADLFRRVREGTLDADCVSTALQEVIEGRYALVDKFGRYADKLLSLEQQLERLVRYNSQYWESYFTEEQLSAFYTGSTHVQSVKKLRIIHVEFGSLEETIKMWWKVFVGEQPASRRSNVLKFDPEHLRLIDGVRRYEPGIHVIEIDLTANWEPQDGRTLIEVRERPLEDGETLAHTEVFSAYGLHTELFREQNGTDLPYTSLPGTEVSVCGDSRPHAVYLYWSPIDEQTRLHTNCVGNRLHSWATPVVREL